MDMVLTAGWMMFAAGALTGAVVGWWVAWALYNSALQEYKKRVKYLQETLSLCNDQDD